MNIRERIRGALRRMSGEVWVEAGSGTTPLKPKNGLSGPPSLSGPPLLEAAEQRRTAQVYTGMPELWPAGGAGGRTLPKPTPANLRRFAETPVARKAINTIKDRVAGMNWRVQPRAGRALLPEHGGPAAELADRLDHLGLR